MESMVSVMLTWTQPWNSLSLVTASQWVILPDPGPPAGTPNSIYISIVTDRRQKISTQDEYYWNIWKFEVFDDFLCGCSILNTDEGLSESDSDWK